MGIASEKKKYTFSEYLDLDPGLDKKYEFFQGEIFAMSGGSANHSLIGMNIGGELRSGLLDRDCSVFNSEFRIRVEEVNAAFYPDCSVFCGELEYLPGRTDVATNPSLVIEVLSESTEKYDRGDKFLHYRKIPSLQEFILISQKKPVVEIFRKDKQGVWSIFGSFEGLDKILKIESLNLEIPLSRIYHRISFPDPDEMSIFPI